MTRPGAWRARAIKRMLAMVTLLLAAGAAQAAASNLRIWHAGTVFANMGQCAITLTLDSQMQQVQNFELKLSVLDSRGQIVARGTVQAPDFGATEAERYQDAHWAHEALCDDGQSLRIDAARARLDGRLLDLVGMKLLSVEDFRPMRIQLPKPRPLKR